MTTIYNGFGGDQPDPARWVVGEIRDGEQLVWRYADPQLQVHCGNDRCTLSIPHFTLSHPAVPMFDNPKALYVATRQWEVGREPLSFGTTMAAKVTGDAQDYRDGFASFNVLDFASGTVLDIISTGERIYAILEQLDLPGVTTAVPPFSDVVDLGVATEPLREHALKIEYDPQRHAARWYVDEVLRLTRDVPMDPKALTLAFGIITLHPLTPAGSASIRGQGGMGTWGPFWYEDGGAEPEPDAEHGPMAA